jgi:hypothetical protein
VVSALNDFFSLGCFHDVDLGSISPVYETIPRDLSEARGLLLLLLLVVVLPSVWLLVLPQSLRGLWQSATLRHGSFCHGVCNLFYGNTCVSKVS